MPVGEPHKPVRHKLTADEAGMQSPVRTIPGSRLDMSAHPTDFKFDNSEARDESGRWTTGSGVKKPSEVQNDKPVVTMDVVLYTPRSNNSDWKTWKEADDGFYKNHSISLHAGYGVKGESLVRQAKAIDKQLGDLKQRFPKLQRLLEERTLAGGIYIEKEIIGRGMGAHTNGCYSAISTTMSIKSGQREDRNKLKAGDWVAGGINLQGTLSHELGHHVMNVVMRKAREAGVIGTEEDDYQDRIAKIFIRQGRSGKIEKELSKYAATNHEEYFAEAFSAYVHPDFEKSNIKIDLTLKKALDFSLKGTRI